MTASVAQRRREDEENEKNKKQKQVEIVNSLFLNDLLVCINVQMTFGQEMEVRMVGEGGRRTLNRLLLQISPEEILALQPV